MSLQEAVDYAFADADPTAGGDHPAQADELLSRREQEVVRLVVRGYTNRQIGQKLVIAEPTAERTWRISSPSSVSTRARTSPRGPNSRSRRYVEPSAAPYTYREWRSARVQCR